MTGDLALQIMGEMLWTAILVCAPVLGFALAVGLAISILQAVTQVQEVSLTFIPKIVAVTVALVIFGPWMLKRTLQFASTLIANIPGYF